MFGSKWFEIALYLPGRSDNCIKNHFYSKLRKILRNYLKELVRDESLNELGIDLNKYNTEYVYKLLKNLNIPFQSITNEKLIDIIKKDSKNILNNQYGFKKLNKKRSDKKRNRNRNIKINVVDNNYYYVINKSIMTKGDVKKEKDKFNDNNKDYIINEINKESTNISQQQNFNSDSSYFDNKHIKINLSNNNLLQEEYERINLHSTQNLNENNNFINSNNQLLMSPLNFYDNDNFLGFPLISTKNESLDINFFNIKKADQKEDLLNNDTHLNITPISSISTIIPPPNIFISDFISQDYEVTTELKCNNFTSELKKTIQINNNPKPFKNKIISIDIDLIKSSNNNKIFNECFVNSNNLNNNIIKCEYNNPYKHTSKY